MRRPRTMYDRHGGGTLGLWALESAEWKIPVSLAGPAMSWRSGGKVPCRPITDPSLWMRLREHKYLIRAGAAVDLREAVKANERQRLAWLAYTNQVSPKLWDHHLDEKRWRAERIPGKIRKRVRESGPCAYCGDPDPREVDHVIPVAQGGTCNPRNLVPAYGPCNRAKGGRTPEQWASGAPVHPNAAARRKAARTAA